MKVYIKYIAVEKILIKKEERKKINKPKLNHNSFAIFILFHLQQIRFFFLRANRFLIGALIQRYGQWKKKNQNHYRTWCNTRDERQRNKNQQHQ